MKRAISMALGSLAAAMTLTPAPALAAGERATGAAPPTPAPRFPTDRLIVEWKSGVNAKERSAGRADADATAIRGLGSTRFQLLRVKSGQTVSGAMNALRQNADVRVVERDGYDAPMALPNDALFGQLWGLRNLGTGINGFGGAVANADIEAAAAWDRTVGTPTTVVADIDSGYRFNHEDLASVAWTNPGDPAGGGDDDGDGIVDDVHGADFVGSSADSPASDGDPTDDDLLSGGHGVHTAGTIGAKGNNGVGITGVAQNVRIMPLRVCSHSVSVNESRCPSSSQILAINYAGAHGARVANISLGGTTFNAAVRDAIAANPQVLFVISAGNDAQDNDVTPHYPCVYDPTTSSVPGAIDNIICVAATDQADHLASFSDWGATSVDVGAPGTETLSTYPRAQFYSENFEVNDFASKWSATTGTGFARGNDAPLTSFGITDSPGATPPASTTVASTSANIPVPAGTDGCSLSGRRYVSLGGGTFTYEVLSDGASAFSFSPANTAGTTPAPFSTVPFPILGGTNLQIRFTYTSGAAPAATDGAWLDDLKIDCLRPVSATTGYGFLQGTSMAAPHVTGSAALLFSLAPSATVAQVRQTLLSTVTPDPALVGKTTSGGRIDVSRALDALVPPDTAIGSGPAGSTTATVATFSFARSDSTLAAATFQCRLDTAAFAPCTSPRTYAVGVGSHTFAVRALSPHLNLDPTPATRAWTVVKPPVILKPVVVTPKPPVKCKVPKLKGKTLAKAKKALKKAHCALGKVKKPKHAKGKLVVKSSSPGSGKSRAAGTKIKLTLVKAKK